MMWRFAGVSRCFSTARGCERILSCIQPTGVAGVHLGNYLGALQQWAQLVEHRKAELSPSQMLFGVVDLHAITVPQDPRTLRESILQTAATLIAVGIDPKHARLFVQSDVPQHAELAWVLGCIAPYGWMSRMTQFKDKKAKQAENTTLGLFAYPALMSADILIYKATHVPVGDDQRQHLELARDLAASFNSRFGVTTFPLPNTVLSVSEHDNYGTRVMSLRDGTKKMSKSDDSDMSRINLTDDASTIRKKIRKAKTDSLPSIEYDPENRPEVANLLNIYGALTNAPSIDAAVGAVSDLRMGEFKLKLAEIVVDAICPVGDRIQQLLTNEGELDEILDDGRKAVTTIAEQTLVEAYKAMGVGRSRFRSSP